LSSNPLGAAPGAVPITLLARFDLIIAILLHIVAEQGHAAGLAQPRLILIWQRLTRLAGRFTRAALMGPTRGRNRTAYTPTPTREKPKSEHTIPNGFGWLRRLLPGSRTLPSAITYPAQQLSDLLADPAMAALIESNPAIGRTLRPLFNALGLDRPPILAIPAPQPQEPPTESRTNPPPPATPSPPARAAPKTTITQKNAPS
jgi:hypothetical protein